MGDIKVVELKMNKSKDYIKGFNHGVKWACVMAKVYLNKYDGLIAQGELGALEINIDNIIADSKKAVKSLKEGR